MSEAALLALIRRHPDAVALARRVDGTLLHAGLRRLEARGLLVRRPGSYRVTARGLAALDFERRLAALLLRLSPSTGRATCP